MLISRDLILQGFLKSGSKSCKPEVTFAIHRPKFWQLFWLRNRNHFSKNNYGTVITRFACKMLWVSAHLRSPAAFSELNAAAELLYDVCSVLSDTSEPTVKFPLSLSSEESARKQKSPGLPPLRRETQILHQSHDPDISYPQDDGTQMQPSHPARPVPARYLYHWYESSL